MRHVRKIPQQGVLSNEWEATNCPGPEILCKMKPLNSPLACIYMYIPHLDMSEPPAEEGKVILEPTWSNRDLIRGKGKIKIGGKGEKLEKSTNLLLGVWSVYTYKITKRYVRGYEVRIHYAPSTKLSTILPIVTSLYQVKHATNNSFSLE